MRCYTITCEFYRPKRSNLFADRIRQISTEWHHPHSGVWIIQTHLNASQIKSLLLPSLDFQDRLFICETGADRAEFNALPSGGGKITRIEEARAQNRMLDGIFSRNGQASRHLKAATAIKVSTEKSLKSA